MGTNRQAEASRENGRRSHGPASPDGKTRTRLNALKNGLFSRETLIPGESVEDFIALRDVVWQQFEPRDATTVILVNELVDSQWRLLRVRRCEAGEIRMLRITEAHDYDVVGTLLPPSDKRATELVSITAVV